MAGEFDVEFDMAVPEDKVVDIGMFLNILLGKEHKVFFIFAHIHRLIALLMLDIAMLGPSESESDAPARMKS